MSILAGLQTSLSGMKVAQSQLSLVSQNIANVDTPNYTRKTAQQNNLVLAGYSCGVELGDITRKVDEGLLKTYLASNAQAKNLNAKYEYLSETEILLGTPSSNNSISANVADLQVAFNTFATDVTSSSGRYELLNNALSLTNRLNNLTNEIQKFRGDADIAISDGVDKINKTLQTLDSLNDDIVKYTVLGYEGKAGLLDQRDDALRDLSAMIDISYFVRDSGEIVIQTSTGQTLLDNDPHYLSHHSIAQASPTLSYAGGGIDGIWVNGVDITSKIKDGELKGLIEVRDEILPSLQSQLDELAGNLKDAVNQIHNQGTAYPSTPSEITGNRQFINSARQQIKITNGDVRFTIFDDSGKEVATTTLLAGMGFNKDGDTIDSMVQKVQDWLRSSDGANLPDAVAKIDENGQFYIDTKNSDYSVSIIDEATSTPGSEQQNVTVSFDATGDGYYNRDIQGFSNFFGLNDFFVAGNEAIYDSKVLNLNANLGVGANPVIWQFSTQEAGGIVGDITITGSDSLQDIVNKINENEALNENIIASLVPNGSGYMLRIVNSTGAQMEITENPGNATATTLIDRIGLTPSYAMTAGSIDVREDIKINPSLISSGSPEFNPDSGEYRLNTAANNIANELSKVFSTTLEFEQAGSIAATKTTLANYAATFVGNVASQTNNAENALTYQEELTNSISTKEATISGVDIDEELSQMIVYQQAYAACAKAFTASKEIMDMLMDIV